MAAGEFLSRQVKKKDEPDEVLQIDICNSSENKRNAVVM